MTVKPKIKEKIIKGFYEFIQEDLKQREENVTRMTEKGELPFGSVSNEAEFRNMITNVLNDYVMRYLE